MNLAQADWGGSTDFYAVMQLIADVVREKKLGAGEIPDLLVVSDMQFNEAVGHSAKRYWQLVRDNIKRMFRDLGLELHGRPLDPPQIIFWNVRADTVGYPAAADDRGVMMLSGFSPALLKFVLSSEMVVRPFIVLTETKPSKRHIPVWDRYSPLRTRVEAHANTLSP